MGQAQRHPATEFSPPRYAGPTWRQFVAVEGVDGSGTSTQSRLVAERLRRAGFEVYLSAEPTDGTVGRQIRRYLRGEESFSPDSADVDAHLAYLFAADRHEHLFRTPGGIAGLLGPRAFALTTRYLFSSLAYNARDREAFRLVERLNAQFPLPQVIVYLEVPPEVTESRLDGRHAREYYETRENLQRVAATYDIVLEPLASRVVRATSTGDPEALADRLASEILLRTRRNTPEGVLPQRGVDTSESH